MLKRLNLPLLLNDKGIYYGYIVLFGGTLGVIMSVPGQTMGISVYTEYLIRKLNISRESLSMMYMLGTLSSAFLLPLAGRVLDKFGARVLAVIASLGLSLSLLFFAKSYLILNYLDKIISLDSSILVLILCFIGFLGLRHFGQGQLTMASRTMMGNWFEKRRGLMVGISGTFTAFAFGGAPLFLNWLIRLYGEESSLLILSLTLLLMGGFAFLFFRRSPEHCGLNIDGGLIATIENDKNFEKLKASLNVAQVKKTFTFWVFNLGMASQALLITAITFHMSDIAKLFHISSEKAYSVFLPISIIATISELIAGYISDRIELKYILSFMQIGLITGLVGFQFFDTNTGYTLVALGFGISGGLFSLLMVVAWPKLFGRLHLGAITGVVTSWMVAGSSIGPYLFSLGKSYSGNYSIILGLGTLIPLAIFLASFFVKKQV